MPLTALITRPEEDARPLAEALAARGVATVIEPLLAIRPLPEAAADLAKDLAGVQALLFTSANGVRAFAELSPRRDIGVLAVGDATASTARGLGFTAVESAGGDVQALARLVKQRLKPAGGPLFHAAGSAVAGDLAERLAADGFDLRRRMLYESATATALSPEALAALKQGRIDLVLLFSPRTAVTFTELARAAAVDASPLTALCPLARRGDRRERARLEEGGGGREARPALAAGAGGPGAGRPAAGGWGRRRLSCFVFWCFCLGLPRNPLHGGTGHGKQFGAAGRLEPGAAVILVAGGAEPHPRAIAAAQRRQRDPCRRRGRPDRGGGGGRGDALRTGTYGAGARGRPGRSRGQARPGSDAAPGPAR